MNGMIRRSMWCGVVWVAVSVGGVSVAEIATNAPTVENEALPRMTPFHYSSDDGAFQVTWPSGCAKLRERSNNPVYYEGEKPLYDAVLVRAVSCDRFDAKGEGCSVAAVFNVRSASGGEAGPDEVIARVTKMLKTYGASIDRQKSVTREYPDGSVVEGIDVIGTGAKGIGRVWVRGLLSYHDIYVLSAWSVTENVWENPEYQEFFNGFIPHAE